MNLLSPFKNITHQDFKSEWRSPSNIAFVKYWGKKGHQIPANPSVSMTLKACYTQTSLEVKSSDELKVDLFLDGKLEERFGLKVKNYFDSLGAELPWIKNRSFKIETKNTFPHGAGIASSASGLSAIALGLTDYLHQMNHEDQSDLFFKRASHLSRLASGSACRSVYGGFTSWGEFSDEASSDLYATPFNVHASMSHLNDSVLVISDKEKAVSSRAGHDRMKEHAFSEARFVQAKKNFEIMCDALRTGDFETMGLILENEALTLHAMMMTSPDSFTLLKPNSLLAIELIRDFRQQTKLPLYFTLDAGPNLHLIYPDKDLAKIEAFISHELKPLTTSIIRDERGEGPVRC